MDFGKPYLGNDVKLEPPVLSAVIGDMVSVLTPAQTNRLRKDFFVKHWSCMVRSGC